MNKLYIPSGTITDNEFSFTVSGYEIYPKPGSTVSSIRVGTNVQNSRVYEFSYFNCGEIIEFWNADQATLTTFRDDLIAQIDHAITAIGAISKFLGVFVDDTALTTAYPTSNIGFYAEVVSTATVWVWDEGTLSWVDSGASTSSLWQRVGTTISPLFPDDTVYAAELDYRSLTAETASRTIYVATTGSDTTGTGLVGAPFATLARAFRDVKNFVPFGVTITIQLATGTYTQDATSAKEIQNHLQRITGGGVITVRSASGSEWAIEDSGTTTADTYFVHTDGLKSWGINDHRGRMLRDGAAGQIFPIESNTDKELYCGGSTTFGVVSIGAYDILSHNVIINAVSNVRIFDNANTPMGITLYFQYVKLDNISFNGKRENTNIAFNYCSVMSSAGTSSAIMMAYNKYYPNQKTYFQAYQLAVINGLYCAVTLQKPGGINPVFYVYESFGNSIIGADAYLSCGAIKTSLYTTDIVSNHLYVYDLAFRNFKYGIETVNYIAPLILVADTFEYFTCAFFLKDQYAKTQIIADPAFPFSGLGTPDTAPFTIDGTNAATTYINVRTGLDCSLIAPDQYNYASLNPVFNLDVDTGTEVVDSFADTTGNGGCRWDYVVNNGSGTNMRMGTVQAVWDQVAGSTPQYRETSTGDIGSTAGVAFTVDKSGNTVRLLCTVGSDNWKVNGNRNIV